MPYAVRPLAPCTMPCASGPLARGIIWCALRPSDGSDMQDAMKKNGSFPQALPRLSERVRVRVMVRVRVRVRVRIRIRVSLT